MAVRIRMKKLGRINRPFFRVVAVDSRKARDGRVLEYLGHYDPQVTDTDARAVLNGERIDYWLSVGAQPSDKVQTLIKKYGTKGTHLEQQKSALAKRKSRATYVPPKPVTKYKTLQEMEAEARAAEAAAAQAAQQATEAASEGGESAG